MSYTESKNLTDYIIRPLSYIENKNLSDLLILYTELRFLAIIL